MFEVVITKRPDFGEYILGRYTTEDEAQSAAREISLRQSETIVRAWVRVARQARSNP